MAAAPQAEEAIINEPIDMIRLSLDDRVYVKCRYGIAASDCLEADRGRSPSAPVLLLLPCRDGSHPGRQAGVCRLALFGHVHVPGDGLPLQHTWQCFRCAVGRLLRSVATPTELLPGLPSACCSLHP